MTLDPSLSTPEPQFTTCKMTPHDLPHRAAERVTEDDLVRSSVYREHSVPRGLVPTIRGTLLDVCL